MENQLRRDLQGVRVGVYEIVRRIGHGATSVVYEARHTVLGRSVALKVLHEHLAENGNLVARLQREARIAASIRHPNIVDVIDIARHDGLPVLVMELLDGTDLESWIRAQGSLTVAEALRTLVPIASAIAWAHERGVVHRDLKPGNVVLARDRRGDVVPKIVDFGLSKQLGADSSVQLTAATAVLGTLGYIAPEQLLGSAESDARGDQYSFGAILYSALAGRPPYEASGLVEMATLVRSGPPPALHGWVEGVPPELSAVIARSLERDPAARHSDVRAFARALLPFADQAVQDVYRRELGAPEPSQPEPPKPDVAQPEPPSPETKVATTTRATSHLPATATGRVKGTNVMRAVKWLRTCRADALAILPPNVHHYLDERILVSSWFPERDQLELIVACAATMPFPPELAELDRYHFIGKQTAPLDLGEFYKSILERGDLMRTISKATVLWRNYHDTGKVTSAALGPGVVEVSLREYGASCAIMCSLIRGYFEGVVEYGGGIVRASEEARCQRRGDDACVWKLSFD